MGTIAFSLSFTKLTFIIILLFVGRAVGLILLTALPDNDFSFCARFVKVDDSLVVRSAKSKSQRCALLYKSAVNEDVGERKKLLGSLDAVRVIAYARGKLLVGIARVYPHGFDNS